MIEQPNYQINQKISHQNNHKENGIKRFKYKPLLAAMLSATLGLSTPSFAVDYPVTAATDDGTGGTPNTLSWAILQANTNAGTDSITLNTDVTITGVMKRLINSDLSLQSDSTVRSISGGDTYRPLFVKSGTVTIKDLNLTNGKAKGGDSIGGGGGAGLGGAVFVYGGNVTINNVVFNNNNASGGSTVTGTYTNGGGGMFGSSSGINANYGGGGLFSSSTDVNGAYGGNGNYGGSAGGFGGGGKTFSTCDNSGGFGGGGGGCTNTSTGSTGGFGGGGGVGIDGGLGGFGGGGGDGIFGAGPFSGGYGGGNGEANGGGGGAGFGGAIFAMKGTITLIDASFTNNSVLAGTGANSGSASANDIFICTTQDPLCSAVVNVCGTTNTSEIIGTLVTNSCSETFLSVIKLKNGKVITVPWTQ